MPRTSAFIESAELYDAIFHFKDYAREGALLRRLLSEVAPGAHSLLDVACGTGEHAKFLSRDYAIDGVDINENYLHAARVKNPSGDYIRADMTDFDLGRTYDVVTCLFSAIGIVKTFQRLESAIRCMARHVKPEGVLIIEPWFTPENWSPGQQLVFEGEVGADKVYRLSTRIKEGQNSVLLNNYVRATAESIEHYRERIELGLFTRDEMVWAFEFAGMRARYDAEGLIGRGLYIGKHSADGVF